MAYERYDELELPRSTPAVYWLIGLCVGVFRPKALRQARSGMHIALHWDGQRITHCYEKRSLQTLP